MCSLTYTMTWVWRSEGKDGCGGQRAKIKNWFLPSTLQRQGLSCLCWCSVYFSLSGLKRLATLLSSFLWHTGAGIADTHHCIRPFNVISRDPNSSSQALTAHSWASFQSWGWWSCLLASLLHCKNCLWTNTFTYQIASLKGRSFILKLLSFLVQYTVSKSNDQTALSIFTL